MPFRKLGRVIVAIALLFSNQATASTAKQLSLLQLRAADVRLARVAHRLVVANAFRCKQLMPATGAIVHAIDQYPRSLRLDAEAVFSFEAPISIEAIVPGSPADISGVKQNDGLVGVNMLDFLQVEQAASPTSASRDYVERTIAGLEPAQSMAMHVRRNGELRTLHVGAIPACRTRFEVLQADGVQARSNGETIQISSAFLASFDDDALAVAFAHELSHTILGHRIWLEQSGAGNRRVTRTARDRKLIRQAEDEADRFSLRLLASAGYDPAIAPRFWRTSGKRLGQGIFRSRTHASAQTRADAMEAEIALGLLH